MEERLTRGEGKVRGGRRTYSARHLIDLAGSACLSSMICVVSMIESTGQCKPLTLLYSQHKAGRRQPVSGTCMATLATWTDPRRAGLILCY